MPEDKGRIIKREFVREISEEINVREPVVELVLDAFVSMAIEKIVNTGEFSVTNLFTVSNTVVKNAVVTKNPKADVVERVTIPDYQRLTIKLSRTAKELFKLQQSRFKEHPYMINRYNWKDALAWARKNPRGLMKELSNNEIQ